jgi:hypothetical protein
LEYDRLNSGSLKALSSLEVKLNFGR